VAHKFSDNTGVVGVDITLSLLEEFTVEQRVSTNGGIALLTENMDLLASTPQIRPFLKDLIAVKAPPPSFLGNAGIQTIVMLEHLSFPKNLQRVPIYAGNHHEALNGLGYPRGLKAAELSIPERIIAISDIFEALTSMDRPYKKPNTMSMAIGILHDMKTKGFIDPDLFDMLLTSGVDKQYGDKFLSPGQMDTVDIKMFL